MAKVKFHGMVFDPETYWRDWFMTSAFGVEKKVRHLYQMLPNDPRCKFCYAPFQGIGGILVRTIFQLKRSSSNPNFCNMCEEFARQFRTGSEVEMSMLFADVRGSTALSEKM